MHKGRQNGAVSKDFESDVGLISQKLRAIKPGHVGDNKNKKAQADTYVDKITIAEDSESSKNIELFGEILHKKKEFPMRFFKL